MPRPLQEIQSRLRREQRTDAWRRHHAVRIGCEATVSEAVRAHGLRNCRYRGQAKMHVQHVLTAAGTNLVRLSECLPPGTIPPRTLRPPPRFRQLWDRQLTQHPH
ncbi:transposase [Embleya sp. NPDC020630]|uniref:transposase n=1 Tax=Embleya sp. NPDC020630 TaxID=3363979 RepID=UPI0037A9EFE2